MGDREALLRAVCANPDDDTPRLVYADWLDDHGDPDRAAFIRLQVRVAMLYRSADPRAAEPVHREARAVWDRCGEAWRAALPTAGGAVWPPLMFFRGFPERLWVPTDAALVAAVADLLNRVPVQHLEVGRFTGDRRFAGLAELGRLKTLTVTNYSADERVVREFIRCHARLSPTALVSSRFGTAGGRLQPELLRAFGTRLHSCDAPPQVFRRPTPAPTPAPRRGWRRWLGGRG